MERNIMQNISVIIPVIRPQYLERLFGALKRNSKHPIEVIYEVDKDRIGCPKMVKLLVERASHDLIMFLGDDTVPLKGFDTMSVEAMERIGWGLVGLNDMATQNPTHWLAHKKLLEELGGEFFHTGYKHCFCDNELKLRAEKLGRYVWAEAAKILHFNPVIGRGEFDKDYERVYSKEYWEHDKTLFEKRKKEFAF